MKRRWITKSVLSVVICCALLLTGCKAAEGSAEPEHEVNASLPATFDVPSKEEEVTPPADTDSSESTAPVEPSEGQEPTAPTTGDTALDAKINKIIDSVTNSGMSDEEKLKAVYMWVAKKVRYKAIAVTEDHSESYSDELIASLVNTAVDTKKGSCEHIAAVTYVLFEMLDTKYQPILVDGSRYDESNGTWGEHTWVIMEINGSYRHFDALFGRNHMGDPMNAYMVTDDVFEGNHTWDTNKYPVCK